MPEALRPRATAVSVKGNDFSGGALYALIDGKQRKLADDAVQAWNLESGRYVAFSGRDGSGGFENEGMSLRVFDTQTGRISKVMSEYVMVDSVTSVKLSNGKTALLVAMSDGGDPLARSRRRGRHYGEYDSDPLVRCGLPTSSGFVRSSNVANTGR